MLNEKTTVEDVLKEKGYLVISIAPEDTVYNAIKMMADKKIGALLVSKGDKVEGIISERDYTWKVILKGRASKSTTVEEIMSKELYCVGPEVSIEEAMAIMAEKNVRHLPVLKENRCVGIVNLGDLVKRIITQQEAKIQHLISYISDSYMR